MTAEFATESINNFLPGLTDDEALMVLALSTAANDLASCQKVLKSLPEVEQTYFFALSLSILRELAKVVADVRASFDRAASIETMNILAELSSKLTPFDDDSLSKSVLKPVRDLTSHYDYKKMNKESHGRIDAAIVEVKKKATLSISFDSSKSGLLKNRYVFADEFRASLIGQWLTTDLVTEISTIAVSVLALVDSLLHDLTCRRL
jgi:hypothetical protein